MKLAVIGVGSAGTRIANRILEVERSTGRNLCRGNALAINTAPTEFDVKEHVPEDSRLLIGDVHDGANGDGVGGDQELAAEIARDELNEIRRAFDAIGFAQIDGVLLAAGLGGGTGSGAGAVVLDELQAICEKPVYALSVLPTEDEGIAPALNAARALQSFVERADNVIACDNEAWHSNERSVERGYERTNQVLAIRVVSLFAAGEFDSPRIAENRMDPSDIIRTLDTGGISSIGYAETRVSRGSGGVLSWLRGLPWFPGEREDGEDASDAAKINRLVRQATRSRLTLPCEVSSAERALIVLSGPSSELSRKGFESGRYWLEEEADTVEVLAGDEPHERSSKLTATVLLSNVTEVPRIDAMQEQATGERANFAERAAMADDGDD